MASAFGPLPFPPGLDLCLPLFATDSSFSLNLSVCALSHVQLLATPWTVALQAPLSMGVSRQEYWSGLPCPPPGDLPDAGIEPASATSPALARGLFTTEPPKMHRRE